jgi:CRP-like cAMP-binding protein
MRAFLRYLVDRIRALSSRMTDVTTRNAEQRLISELLSLARPVSPGADQGLVEPLPTQQELATLIFSQRESVGRDMSKLKEAGLIERHGRALTIKSLRRLEARLGG